MGKKRCNLRIRLPSPTSRENISDQWKKKRKQENTNPKYKKIEPKYKLHFLQPRQYQQSLEETLRINKQKLNVKKEYETILKMVHLAARKSLGLIENTEKKNQKERWIWRIHNRISKVWRKNYSEKIKHFCTIY